MLPGEADSAERLDRLLAGQHRSLPGLRLRRRHCKIDVRIALGDAPRRPVGERPAELDGDIAVDERVRDRLVNADLLAELLALTGVRDRQVERLCPDANCLERERGEQPAAYIRPITGGGLRTVRSQLPE